MISHISINIIIVLTSPLEMCNNLVPPSNDKSLLYTAVYCSSYSVANCN